MYMKFIIVAGTPGAGKTAVLTHAIKALKMMGVVPSVVKIDCLYTEDAKRFAELGVPVKIGLSKDMCPDHFSIYNTGAIVDFAVENGSEYLIMETAGLCHRCAPFTSNSLGICVIDVTCGPNNPAKLGPFLSSADLVVTTKGDMVSQAEREIFRERVLESNPQCRIIEANGLSGQGGAELAQLIARDTREITQGEHLRHNAPFSVCTLCAGEKRIGANYHRGLLREMDGLQTYVGE
jgi:Ni2+-binding GTPase involved in maturation of urease and hydrogenase